MLQNLAGQLTDNVLSSKFEAIRKAGLAGAVKVKTEEATSKVEGNNPKMDKKLSHSNQITQLKG